MGYVCCLESVLLSVIQKCNVAHYQPVTEDPSFNLQERQGSPHYSPQFELNRTTHNYKPNINYPIQTAILPSTSRQHEPSSYLDDVQPCSSKSVDNNYRMA